MGDCTAVPDTSSPSILLSTLAARSCCQGAQEDAWAGNIRTGLTHTQGTPDSASGRALGPHWGSGSIPGESRSESTVNAVLPENAFLLLISSRQIIAFAAAWLFREKKCNLSALHGGDLVEMLRAGVAGARSRLSCRRHLVGKGEKDQK